jgi:hypothetical protein
MNINQIHTMKKITYRVAQIALEAKITPQIKKMYENLATVFLDQEFSAKDVEEKITPESICTKQSVARIFAYYVKDMCDAGMLERIEVITESKPAKISTKAQILTLLDDEKMSKKDMISKIRELLV